MKKHLLIAAVAATMTSVAMADISITGAAQVNFTTTDYDSASSTDTNAISHDFDLKITGKSGATSVVMDIENTDAGAGDVAGTTTVNSNEMNVKNAYMTTSIAGVNVKMGTWYGSDSLLGNGSQTANQVSLDTTISGVKVQYEDNMTSQSVTLSGSVAGVALSHEIFESKTDTSVSGSFGGVNATYRSINDDVDTKDATSLEVSTEMQGVTVTYAAIDANEGTTDATGVTSDAFFGEVKTGAEIKEADGFGIATNMAGNTVSLKSYTTMSTGNVEQDWTKLVVTRPLANGATVEVTYTDKDAVSTSMDLELRVKF